MSAGARAGKHRSSQNKLNGERGTSPPMSRAGNKELQEWKIHWNGDTKDAFLKDTGRYWAGRGG